MMKKEFIVTPWETKGKIDYNKLVKEFGLQYLKNLPQSLKESLLFRRDIIFAHRDFNRIIDCIQNKKTPLTDVNFGYLNTQWLEMISQEIAENK